MEKKKSRIPMKEFILQDESELKTPKAESKKMKEDASEWNQA
jgi:hypothetical protein